MSVVGAVSNNRIREIFGKIFGIPLSTGTVTNMVERCAGKLDTFMEEINRRLLLEPVVNCDETGTRVDGKLHWVHTFCTKLFTSLDISTKRGKTGMDEIGLIPNYHGTLIHDFWSSCLRYDDVTHGVCCAHLLRELKGGTENYSEYTWASKFAGLLMEMKHFKENLLENGIKSMTELQLNKFYEKYDQVINLAYEEVPEPYLNPKKSKRGRQKRGKILSLVDRLAKYKGQVCLFAKNFIVPFDNNMAERSFICVKTKTKVSGCFRSLEKAKSYLKIMSLVGTAKKHLINAYEAILLAVSGNPTNVLGCT